MKPETATRVLRWLMIAMGVMGLLAVFAAVMPTSWIEAATEACDLERLPRSPLTEYLTRSVSLIYAMLGAMTIYLALNVVRYLDLIRFIGGLTIAFGVALIALDFGIGMPALWSWGEGPPTVLVGAAFVWLARRAG